MMGGTDRVGRDAAFSRVKRLIEASRRVADRADPLGQETRERLGLSTGLSTEGIELAFSECLEVSPSNEELASLLDSACAAPKSHVVLGAHVFVAAHRALAIALAGSEFVDVRPSRRDPVMVDALCRAAPGLFRVVAQIRPQTGDAVWAYGSDETLTLLSSAMPGGVRFIGHGTGFGVVAIDARAPDFSQTREDILRGLVRDVVLFDQRGCLSPRVVFFRGGASEAVGWASALAAALAAEEKTIPPGPLDEVEGAAIARYRDTACFASEIFEAGRGFVSLSSSAERLILPPVGRNIHVAVAEDFASALAPIARNVTVVGISGLQARFELLRERVPGARLSAIGRMQSPPFDGPVDLRPARIFRPD